MESKNDSRVLGAADVGANHQRDRIWIVGKMANTKKLFSDGCKDNTASRMEREKKSKSGNDCGPKDVSNTNSPQCQGESVSKRIQKKYAYASDSCWWGVEPNVGRMVDGLASGTDRLKAIGNGQVPLCAATAFRILSQNI